MNSERTYLVKLESGEELGPLDKDALIRLAESSKITPNAEIRGFLVPRWDKAVSIPFLKPLLLEKQAEEILDQKLGLWTRIKNRATFRSEDSVALGSLVKTRAETFARAPVPIRILAAAIDLLIVIVGSLIITALCYFLLKREALSTNNAAYVLMLLCWCWINFYYIFFISVKTQTLGQKFWGIFLVRTNAMKFYAGRVFIYMFFMLLFGWLTPLHASLSPSKRSWQEILTGTKMVRTKLADASRIR